MRRTAKGLLALAAGGGLAVAPLLAATPALALPSTVYVSPTGTILNAGTSCQTAKFQSITLAMVAVASGGTVIVCPGTYNQDAVVLKPLTLQGQGAAVIDATAKLNGVSVVASNVTVEDLAVENAIGDGILVAGNGATIQDNTSDSNGATGISFNGSSSSSAIDNTVQYNTAGGINLADDLGATSDITVQGNDASDNPGGCGIIMASHTGDGVYGNVVRDDVADGNGTNPASSGSGILVATGASGGAVYRQPRGPQLGQRERPGRGDRAWPHRRAEPERQRGGQQHHRDQQHRRGPRSAWPRRGSTSPTRGRPACWWRVPPR